MTVESITFVQIRDFVIVAAALLGFVVLLGNFWKTMHEWRKPKMDETEWKREVDGKLANDNKRLKTLEDGNKAVCHALIALLSHEINGNSIDKLQHALDGLNEYLIER